MTEMGRELLIINKSLITQSTILTVYLYPSDYFQVILPLSANKITLLIMWSCVINGLLIDDSEFKQQKIKQNGC